MKLLIFLTFINLSYALEIIICDVYNGEYDCQTYSEKEQYLENVINVTESEGMNTEVTKDYEESEESTDDFMRYIFPL